MGLIRDRSRGTAPLKMLVFGLILIGIQAYMAAGSEAGRYLAENSLRKLLIQAPAGIVAAWIASRFLDVDFGTLGGFALRILAIDVMADGVACWVPIPILGIMAEVVVMLLGYFLLFELTKWQSIFVVVLNFIVLFGAYDFMANEPRWFGARHPHHRAARWRYR
ncbi:hypothetical protein TA3x_005496 [Tundrisphaera sp. TA3]|uniref:hypothetical protein n=1 Tax=Tundrisphaera sp. TA3 TaxID=3435775 RepID=UPI003EBB179D